MATPVFIASKKSKSVEKEIFGKRTKSLLKIVTKSRWFCLHVSNRQLEYTTSVLEKLQRSCAHKEGCLKVATSLKCTVASLLLCIIKMMLYYSIFFSNLRR